MFWGLMLKANRKYSQTILKPFHLSQAALDVKSCSDENPVQVLLTTNKSTYVLCTLRLNTVEQVPLDLNFEGGAEISFASQGAGNVHLTGYLVEDFDGLGEDAESDLENENEVDELPKKKQKQKNNSKKAIQNEVKENESSDDDSSDDEDFEVTEMNVEKDSDEDEDEEVDDSDEEEDSDDSDEEEEVQEPKSKQQKLDKPKENGVEKQQQSKKGKKDQSAGDKSKGVEKSLQGGVKIEDIKVGTGVEAKAGKKVNVYYAGRLKSNNKMFDSSLSGNGFKFALGRGEVIKGWDIGVAGMKVGGKRRITCPPNMAYGSKGSPPVIPPNSTLVFDVELRNVN